MLLADYVCSLGYKVMKQHRRYSEADLFKYLKHKCCMNFIALSKLCLISLRGYATSVLYEGVKIFG